jgi:autotransporter adhesin
MTAYPLRANQIAFALVALALSGAAAKAGCNSGNADNTSALHTHGCHATAADLTDGTGSTAVGTWAITQANFATVFGLNAGAHGEGGTTVGPFAGSGTWAAGKWSTAIGAGNNGFSSAEARVSYSIAIGGGDHSEDNPGAFAQHNYGIAIGTGASAWGQRSVAVGDFAGRGAFPGSEGNSAFGSRAGRSVDGNGNIAFGPQSGTTVKGSSNVAIGVGAGAAVTGNGNNAVGALAGWTVNGRNNAAYGINSGGSVTGDANVAIGASAGRNFTASNTVAVGAEASVSRNGAVALGFGARATRPQAVAIGQGSLANVANTVSVGRTGAARRIVNVANGINPNDMVSLGQVQALLSARASETKPAGADSLGHSDTLLPARNAPAVAATRRPAAADSTSRLIDQVRRADGPARSGAAAAGEDRATRELRRRGAQPQPGGGSMTHIHCVDRAGLPQRSAAGSNRGPATGRRHVTLLARSAFTAAAVALAGSSAMAGCVSGDVAIGGASLLDGPNCKAQGRADYATAVGAFAGAGGQRATAVGDSAHALNHYATALGTLAAGSLGATTIGHAAASNGKWSVAIGAGPSLGPWSVGDYSIAIGGGDGGTAGNGAFALHSYGIAIGTGARATGLQSVAVGAFAGANADAANENNSAFGSTAGHSVTGALNTALGRDSGRSVNGDGNSAFGYASGKNVTGNTNTAGGYFAGVTVNGSFNAAYGASAGRVVAGDANVAIGKNAGGNFTASNTVAMGAAALASRDGTVAFGYGAKAVRPQAVAIGQGSVANVANTVSVGRAGKARRIVNVADGVNPTDMVNLGQLQALLSTSTPAAKPSGTVNLAQFEALLPSANVAAVTTRPVAADSTARLIEDIRRELREEFRQATSDLRTLVQRQQDEIAELQGRIP